MLEFYVWSDQIKKGILSGTASGVCIVTPHSFFDVTQDLCGISGHDGIGRNITCDHAAGAYDRVLADLRVGKNRSARPDGCALSYDSPFDFPVGFGLQRSFAIRCSWIAVVDEGDAVSNKDVVFNNNTLTYEGVT